MGMLENNVYEIYMASLVHDVGKIAVPAEILSKPGRLSSYEMDIIRTHSVAGHEIVKDVEFPWPIAQIILQHHERMDGSGYPQGLKADQILPEARILAVADVVEAMSSHRPYRAALGLDKALAEIETHKGTLYDVRVVEACVKVFREKNLKLDD